MSATYTLLPILPFDQCILGFAQPHRQSVQNRSNQLQAEEFLLIKLPIDQNSGLRSERGLPSDDVQRINATVIDGLAKTHQCLPRR